MRIIAGRLKGTRLFAPKNDRIRPTSDRVREFIFSYLGNYVDAAQVLDLFCGTGAMGLEAWSRGAREVTFVDQSQQAIEILYKNLHKVGLEIKPVKRNVESYLKQIPDDAVFDLILCDPPYAFQYFEQILQLVLDRDVLAPEGRIIYESAARQASPSVPGLSMVKEKIMGDTKITVYEKL